MFIFYRVDLEASTAVESFFMDVLLYCCVCYAIFNENYCRHFSKTCKNISFYVVKQRFCYKDVRLTVLATLN